MVSATIESNEQTRIIETEILQAGYHKKMRDNCITKIASSGGAFRTLNIISYTSCSESESRTRHENVYDAVVGCKKNLSDADYKTADKLSHLIQGAEDYQIRTTRNPGDPLHSMLINVVYTQPIYISQKDTRSVETKDAAVAKIKAAIDYSIILKKCHDAQEKKTIEHTKATESTWK